MAESPILPGHTKITYPAWYDGELPHEDGTLNINKSIGDSKYQHQELFCFYDLGILLRSDCNW